MTGASRTRLGRHGVERAAVWSAVGFALSVVAFRALDALGTLGPLGGVRPAWVAGGCAAVTAVGTVAFARVGGGSLPCVLLAYGPFSGILLETVGPTIRLGQGGGVTVDAAAGTGLVTGSLALLEPFGAAVAVAVAVGGSGYVAGRGIAGVLGTGDTDDD
jgi:hypothetical protein